MSYTKISEITKLGNALNSYKLIMRKIKAHFYLSKAKVLKQIKVKQSTVIH